MISRNRPREAPSAVDLAIDGRDVSLWVRRSPRARRYSLRLSPVGEFILTLPAGGSLARGVDFARAQAPWIRRRLGRLKAPVALADGAVIPLRGVDHVIRHAGTRRGTVSIEPARERDMPAIVVAGDPAHLARRLGDFLRAEARRDLAEAVERHAKNLGVSVRRVVVRDQTSRWGSCSSRGTLSFSWRLILAPPEVLDYLAAHEVAHLREMNHGPGFWRLVRRLAPSTDAAERWLKRHGSGLHRYGMRSSAQSPSGS